MCVCVAFKLKNSMAAGEKVYQINNNKKWKQINATVNCRKWKMPPKAIIKKKTVVIEKVAATKGKL